MLAIYLTLIDNEDVDLFEQVYNDCEHKLFGLSMAKLHNAPLVEEAVSETFLSLAKSFQKVNKLSLTEIVAYTVIINRNICYDILKKEKNHQDNIQFSDYINEEAKNDNNIEKLFTADMVNSLPDPLKDTVMLRYYYGFSYSEIANSLKISLSGVKFRLKKAKEILSKELE